MSAARGERFPPIEPHTTGMLRVTDGSQLYWEESGTPGAPALLWLHGGPGSGLGGGGYRRNADPARWRIIGLDQRGCGRSRPLASDDGFDLDSLTTDRMIEDLEELREHLGVDRWLVAGGSWGSTLALAYAQAHPDRVTAIVLTAVTTTSRDEVEWITETIGRVFPREWDAFAAASGRTPGQRVVDAYAERLADLDPQVRLAAALAWCAWEDVHVSLDPAWSPWDGYRDPEFCLLFATQVVQLWRHHAFRGDHGILDAMPVIADIPGVLIHGRVDVSGPLVTALRVHERWPASRLEVVQHEGHGGPEMTRLLVQAYAQFEGR